MNWKDFISVKRNRIELAITVVLLALILFSFTNFLNFVEERPGVDFTDPVLKHFDPVDLTWLTFALIYISLLTAVVSFSLKPEKLLFAFQLYSLMVCVRIAAMYLLPLEPPATLIVLNDPFVELFGTGQTLTKDLFFSGHTATLFILFLVEEKKILRSVFLICTVVVAISVLIQHVHYTIDVFAAVFFTYTCYVVLKKIKLYLNKSIIRHR
ncbi:MAG TPA: phosphatase PAP2-related protein [Ignavibacteriaceae bacterium]|nr:phosphatase PAP2-related protein [Ignavibacteriaceae bacterium]